MIRVTHIIVSGALAALLAGCSDVPAVFEDVGNDPHPPSLTLLGIGLQLPTPAPPEEPAPPAAVQRAADEPTAPPVSYFPADAVITVRPTDPNANLLALRVSYADAAGDIDAVVVDDLDGSIAGNLKLPQFLGTGGTLEATLAVPATSQEGRHRLEIWAQDANGSRSAKTSFAVIVEIN